MRAPRRTHPSNKEYHDINPESVVSQKLFERGPLLFRPHFGLLEFYVDRTILFRMLRLCHGSAVVTLDFDRKPSDGTI